MIIAGIDPSLSNTAIVIFEIKENELTYLDSVTITTKPAPKKMKIRKSSDLIARCRTIYKEAHAFLAHYNPKVIILESPQGSQNASSMKSYGVSCFLAATFSPSPIEVTPEEVKKASVGRKTASKQDMIDWAFGLFPEAEWKLNKENRPQVTTEEHKADAIAVVYYRS
jgi:Holliday junction resolvasome RuvABC endonuclease subunit